MLKRRWKRGYVVYKYVNYLSKFFKFYFLSKIYIRFRKYLLSIHHFFWHSQVFVQNRSHRRYNVKNYRHRTAYQTRILRPLLGSTAPAATTRSLVAVVLANVLQVFVLQVGGKQLDWRFFNNHAVIRLVLLPAQIGFLHSAMCIEHGSCQEGGSFCCWESIRKDGHTLSSMSVIDLQQKTETKQNFSKRKSKSKSVWTRVYEQEWFCMNKTAFFH